MTALAKFQRSVRLKYFFRNSPPKEAHPFGGKSSWNPPKASRQIEQYLERIKEGLENPNTLPIRQNLDREANRESSEN